MISNIKQRLGLLAAACYVRSAYAVSCVPVVNSTSIPDYPVALQSYSYCGGLLNVTVYIQNLDYDKLVTLYYTNGQGQQNPLTAVSLGFVEEIDGTNNGWEYWDATNVGVYIDGIDELLNITYQATDIGKTYSQSLNLAVVASGNTPPSAAAPPKPYATPLGPAKDITNWLAPVKNSEAAICKIRMFDNVNIPGAAPGTVIAAQSYTNPDYAYNWVRDSSLTMDVVNTFYSAASSVVAKDAYEKILFQYAQAGATEQTDKGLITGLGEPKFNLNNTVFTGPWGRPQNDGPATRAITLMEFATAYLAKGGSLKTVEEKIWDSSKYPLTAPVMKDLEFVATNWSSPSFDLWEEEESDHFYTRLVQRRALVSGSAFAKKMGSVALSKTLLSAASALSGTLSQFWDQGRMLLLYEYGPVLRGKGSYKDIAVVLGVIHGYAGDGVYGYTNDQVLSSAYQIATSFIDVYPIANITKDKSGLPLGIPVGRYPEDTYNGTGTSGLGNPWFLCTASMAELLYRAASEYKAAGSITVTSTSQAFFKYFAPSAKYTLNKAVTHKDYEFDTFINALIGSADLFVRRIKYHTPANGILPEEYDRATGVPTGAAALTWSLASVLTASFARAQILGETNYIRDLANL